MLVRSSKLEDRLHEKVEDRRRYVFVLARRRGSRVRLEINDRRKQRASEEGFAVYCSAQKAGSNWSRLRGMWAPLLRAYTFGVTDLRVKSV